MNERTRQLPPNSEDRLGPDDIFSQVLGPDKFGRVRMCGSGVHSSDVWGDTPSHSTSRRIIAEQHSELEKMKTQLSEQATQLREQGQQIAEMHALLLSQRNNPSPRDSRAMSMESNRSPTPTTSTGTLRVLNFQFNTFSFFVLN